MARNAVKSITFFLVPKSWMNHLETHPGAGMYECKGEKLILKGGRKKITFLSVRSED